MKLFELFGRINLKDEISVAISKIVDKVKKLNINMEALGKKSTELGKKMSLFVTAPIIGAGVAIANTALQFEATEAKYATVFEGMTDQADKFLKKFKELTPSTTAEARSMASGIQDLLIPMGFMRSEATDMTGELMHVIGALTNFNSATHTAEDVTSAMQSALLGQFDSLARLGIQLDADTARQKAVQMGLAETTKEVTKQDLAQVVLAETYRQSTDALNAYNEESLDTITRLKIAKADFTDLSVELGNHLLPYIIRAVELLENLKLKFDGLSETQQKTILIVAGLVASIAPLLLIVGNLITSFIAIKPLLVAIGGAFGAISAPIWIIIGAITALIATFTILWKTNEDFRNKVIDIWGKIKEIFVASFEFIKLKAIEIFESLKAWWDEWGFAIVDIFVVYFTILKNTVETVFNVIKAFWEVWGDYIKLYFKFALEQIMNTFKFAFNIIKNIVVTTLTIVKNIVENVIGTTRGILKAVLALMHGDFAGAFDAIKYVVKINLEQAKDIISAIFKFISNIFKDSFYFIKNIVDTNFSFISRLFKTFYDNSSAQTKEFIDNIKNFFESTWKFITNVIEFSTNAIINIIKGFITLFTGFWKGLWDGIRAILSNAWVGLNNSFNYIVKTIIDTFNSFGGTLKQVFSNIWDNIKNTTVNAWEGIKNAVMNPINWIKAQIDKVFGLVDRLKTAVNTVTNLAGKATGLASDIGGSVKSTARSVIQKIPGLATGGNIVQSGRVLVGERGAEYLDLPKGARVTPLDRDMGTVKTTSIKNEFNIANLVVREDADIKKIARELYNMQEAKRRGLGVIGNA